MSQTEQQKPQIENGGDQGQKNDQNLHLPQVNTKENSSQDTPEEGKDQNTEQVEKMMDQMELNQKNGEASQDQTPAMDEEKEISKSSQKKQYEGLDETKYFIEISRDNVLFGDKTILFPGSIEELSVTIGLKQDVLERETNDPMMLRIIARCSNAEFDALDQYVFSVRSNDRFQYFEEVRFKIRQGEKAQVKVAVKIPPVKESYCLEGVLEIQLQNLQPVLVPITAKCQVPNIICVKQLFKVAEGAWMIKVPAKKNQIRLPPIPFKNTSNFSFTLEVETITNESYADRPYDIITQNFVNCQANMQFFVNLQLKQNMNFNGMLPVRDTIRKILVLKIKNSSLYYSFPLEVNVFENTNPGGMS